MNKLFLFFLGDVNSQMLGGIMDSNNCLVGGGYYVCNHPILVSDMGDTL